MVLKKNTDVENLRILVIGDIMLDHYIYGICDRISPEAPVQIVEVKKDEYTLGGAGNVLKNLKALNINPDIISVAGDDDNAGVLFSHLSALGITDKNVLKDKKRCTTVKSRVLVSNHQLIRLDREVKQAIDESTCQRLAEIIEAEIKKYNIVLLSDYNKGLLSSQLLQAIFRACRNSGVKTVVDPKGNDFTKYKGVNVIKPNRKEAVIASGIDIVDEQTLKEACLRIKQITNCDDVIITLSEAGIAMYTDDDLRVIPTKALDVVDVTGAGDTVLASLGVSLAMGDTLPQACDFANHAAAVVVSKVGSATATFDEINQKYNS